MSARPCSRCGSFFCRCTAGWRVADLDDDAPAIVRARAVLAAGTGEPPLTEPDQAREGEWPDSPRVPRPSGVSDEPRFAPASDDPAPGSVSGEQHGAASPMYREEHDRWLTECECGWEFEGATKLDAYYAHEKHVADTAAPEEQAPEALPCFTHRPGDA